MNNVIIKIIFLFPPKIAKDLFKIIRLLKQSIFKKSIKRYSDYFKKININNISFSILLSYKNGYVDNFIHKNGTWDGAVLKEIDKNLKKDSVFLDIGANIGFFSLYASQKCKKVIAFEPIDFLYQQFSKSIECNKIENIDLIKQACGDENKKMEISLTVGNIGASSLAHDNKSYGRQVVEIVRLDDVLSGEKIDLIKIDVEGFEQEVFDGAIKLIEKNSPTIIFEFSPFLYEKKEKDSSLSLLNKVEKMNYKIFDTKTGFELNNKEDLIKRLLTRGGQADLLCTPKKLT